MRLLRFIPIKLTFFLIAGILLGYYLHIPITLAIVLTLISIGVLTVLFLLKKRTNTIVFGVITYVSVLCVGILTVSLSQPKNRFNHYTKSNFQDSALWYLKVTDVLKPNAFTNRYLVDVQEKDKLHVTGKLILNIKKDSLGKPLEIDDQLITQIIVQSIKKPLNPHQFNYSAYLEKLGIYHEAQLKQDSFILVENSKSTIYGYAAKARNHIISKLEAANFGREELGIIKALLLGQRNDISETTYNNYKNAGAVHILAVSGLHIGILLWILQLIFKPLERLPKGKNIKLIIILLLLWGFAFVAGLSASIIRAVTMFSFVAYALYLNRPSNTFNILALSMFFILLAINPMLIFQVGFQMSYAAVLSIIWIYPLLQKFWFPKNIVIRKIWQLLSVSAAAQLGVLPISLFYFHQFPGLFFISNLLIVPFLGLILGMGILVIILSLSNLIHPWIVSTYNFMIASMNSIVEWVAKQEAFLFKNVSFDAVQLIICYILIISLVLALSKSTFKKWAVFLLAIIGFQAWMFYTTYQNNQKNELLVLHQNRNSVILLRKGGKIRISHKNENNYGQKIVTDYAVGERTKIIQKAELKNSYVANDKRILIIDSTGVYSNTSPKIDFLLLTHSPKIHLGRLIDSIQPKYIIADGSNYRSYIRRWKQTCAKRKLPFHYTGEKGAFVLSLQ